MGCFFINMFWPYHSNWWGFPGLVILAGFIILIVALVKNSQNQQSYNNRNFYQGSTANESALDILLCKRGNNQRTIRPDEKGYGAVKEAVNRKLA